MAMDARLAAYPADNVDCLVEWNRWPWQGTYLNSMVTILEKLDQVGGFSRTLMRNGAHYDIGPHRFFTKTERVLDFWRTVDGDQLQ